MLKRIINPVHIVNKVQVPVMEYEPRRSLINLFNPDMNNLTALDFTLADQSSDQDGVLGRWSQEFPRLSSAYQTKADLYSAPWGVKDQPFPFNMWEESTLACMHSCDKETTLGGSTFEQGVWYFSGLPLTDHQDICGIENNFRVQQTALGTEFRPQMYINALNRLRLLDCETQTAEQKVSCP